MSCNVSEFAGRHVENLSLPAQHAAQGTRWPRRSPLQRRVRPRVPRTLKLTTWLFTGTVTLPFVNSALAES